MKKNLAVSLRKSVHLLGVFTCIAGFAQMANDRLAQADDQGDSYGSCKILYPGHIDATPENIYRPMLQSCGNNFGVMYNGHLVNSLPCYSDISSAIQAMDQTFACTQADTQGSCSIIYPGKIDNSRRDCGLQFGVAYNGYFFSETPCYADVSDAIKAMQASPSCQ